MVGVSQHGRTFAVPVDGGRGVHLAAVIHRESMPDAVEASPAAPPEIREFLHMNLRLSDLVVQAFNLCN